MKGKLPPSQRENDFCRKRKHNKKLMHFQGMIIVFKFAYQIN
jgi:hypothetical protein